MAKHFGSVSARDDFTNDIHFVRAFKKEVKEEKKVPLFCSNDFLTLRSGDIIKIKVIKGDDLISCDKNLKSDPWVSIYIKGFTESPSTSVIKKTLNPVWDESFSFTITDNELSCVDIVFRVMDKDMFSDDFMGQSVVYLTRKEFSLNSMKNLSLSLGGVDHGQLQVSIGIFRE